MEILRLNLYMKAEKIQSIAASFLYIGSYVQIDYSFYKAKHLDYSFYKTEQLDYSFDETKHNLKSYLIMNVI